MFFGGRPLGRGVVVVCNFDKRLETLTSRLVWPLWFVCISTHTTAAAVRTVRIDNFSQGIMLASAVGGLFLFRVKHLLECAAVVVVFGNLSRRRRRRRRSTKMFHFYFPVCTKEKGRTKSLSLYLYVSKYCGFMAAFVFFSFFDQFPRCRRCSTDDDDVQKDDCFMNRV